MNKLNEFILIVLLVSMIVLGGCSIVKTVIDVEFEVGYYAGILILLISVLVYAKRV